MGDCCKKSKKSCSETNECAKSGNVLDCLAFLNCNKLSVKVGACTEEERLQNDNILAQLAQAMCCIKNSAFPKEVTYAKISGNASSGVYKAPAGAPGTPKKGDQHVVQYDNGFLEWVFTGSVWVLSKNGLKQRIFQDNIQGSSTVSTSFNLTGLTWEDLDIFWNGQKIYNRNEQITTGVIVWDIDTNTGLVTFYHGVQGSGTPGDVAVLGTEITPCYIEVLQRN